MPTGCKVTFSPWIATKYDDRFQIVMGHRYWISDQIFKFTRDVIETIGGIDQPTPPQPPTPQPPFPPQSPEPHGGSGAQMATDPNYQQASIAGGVQIPHDYTPPQEFPQPPQTPQTFIGRILAYPYLETIDRVDIPIPTIMGHRYLTYQVCDIECQGSGTASIACCDAEGQCNGQLDEESCLALNGGIIYGTTCAEVEQFDLCSLIGACCLPDGTCINTTPACCGTRGGMHAGEATRCSDGDGAQNYCSDIGACCDPHGYDCTMLNQAACNQIGWDWAGAGSSCLDGCGAGVCCVGDLCTLVDLEYCNELNGTWVPGSSDCDPNPCDDFGACCIATGPSSVTCQMTTRTACQTSHGVFYDGETCATVSCPSPGAVCDIPATAIHCFYSFQEWYDALPLCEKAKYIWNGAGSNCAMIDCQYGACCDNTGCQNTLISGCPGHPVTQNWSDGSYCRPVGCGLSCIGACCEAFGNLDLCFTKAWSACNGIFYGTDVACPGGEGASCQAVAGACCVGPFFETCIDGLTDAQCVAMGGIWHPEADLFCASQPPPCMRACCLPGGTCQMASQQHCAALGGTWMMNSTCSQNPCGEPGPCCLCTGCTEILTQSQCVTQGGLWLGGNLPCTIDQTNPINCTAWVSCCPDGDCGPCGDPSAGSCCSEHPQGGCANTLCCLCVCALDPFCCSSGWDGVCVDEHVTNPASPCCEVCSCIPSNQCTNPP